MFNKRCIKNWLYPTELHLIRRFRVVLQVGRPDWGWPIAALLLGAAAIAVAPAALGLGLGELAVETRLGRPFSATIPILVSEGEKWRGRCRSEINPVPGSPALKGPELRMEEQAGRPHLRITTKVAVVEPVIEFTLRLECRPVNIAVRDYLAFLDPVGYGLPATAALKPAPATSLAGVPRRRDATSPQLAMKPGPSPKRKTEVFSKPASEALTVSVDRQVDGAPRDGRLFIPPAVGEPRRVSLKMAWVLNGGRVKAARIAAEERRLQQDALKDASVPGGDEFTGIAQSSAGDETKGLLAADAGDGGVLADAAMEKLAVAEVRIEELNREIQRLNTRLAADRKPPVPARTPPLAEGGFSGWLPWYGWLTMVLAVLLLAVGFIHLGRRRVVPVSVQREPEWRDLPESRRERELHPRKSKGSPLSESSLPGDERHGEPTLPEEVFAGQEQVEAAGERTNMEIPGGRGLGGESKAAGAENIPALAEEIEPAPESAGNRHAPSPEARKLQVGEHEYEKILKSVPAVMLEVELHLLYEQHDEAISILTAAVDQDGDDKPDIRPWTALFRLHRNTQQRDSFDELAARFRRRYNIAPPEWGSEEIKEEGAGLEDKFPSVVEKIRMVWGTTEALELLNTLLLDNRGGERRGFDLGVAEDITLLRGILYEVAAAS